MNIDPSVSDSTAPLYEKKSFCILLGVGFVIALIATFILWNTYVVPERVEQGIGGAPVEQATQVENNPEVTQEAALPERVFTGTLMFLQPDASFMRISVKGEGVYSVALTPETKVTLNGLDTDIKALKPMSTVSVTALVLPDTEPYDFSAQSVAGNSGVSTAPSATTSTTSTGSSVAGAPVATPSMNAGSQGIGTQEKLKELIKESAEAGMFRR